MLKKLLKNDYSKGVLVLTIATLIGGFANSLFHVLSGKSLLPSQYGELVALISYLNILSFPIQVISLIIIQNIASRQLEKRHYSSYLERWFLNKLKRWLPFIILFILMTPFLPGITNLSLKSWVVVDILFVASLVSTFYFAALQANRLFTLYALISILAVEIKLVGPILVTLGMGGVNSIYFFLISASLIGIMTSLYFFKRIFRKSNTVLPKMVSINKNIASFISNQKIALVSLSILSMTLFGNVDIAFVKKNFGMTDAGLYAAWSFFSKIIFYLTGPLASILYVYYSSKKSINNQKKIMLVVQLGILAIGITLFAIYFIFDRLLINFFYNHQYANLTPYLKYAALFGLFYSSIICFNNYFLAKKSFYSLILIFFQPLYFFCLLLATHNSLINVIYINIFFTITIFFVYLICFLRVDFL